MINLNREPDYRWNTPLLNRFGAQALRTVARRTQFVFRQVPRRSEQAAHTAHFEALDRDGIVTIRDFLPADVFATVVKDFNTTRAADNHPRIRRLSANGIDNWSPIVLAGDPAFQATNRAVRNHLTIRALVEHIVRTRIDYFPPAISFLSQRPTPGIAHPTDSNAFLHGDLHFPTSKAVLYLNDVTQGGAPFVYCYGSHRLTWERLWHEHRWTTEVDAERAAPGTTGGRVVNGAPALTIELARQLGYDPRPIYAPANTLIVADHFGLHSRGDFDPGRHRDTLRISFRYVESRRYRARRLLKIYHRLRGVDVKPYDGFDGDA